MQLRKWIKLTDGLFVDPVIVEGVELKHEVSLGNNKHWFVRLHSANSFYDSLYMSQEHAVKMLDGIVTQLVPE